MSREAVDIVRRMWAALLGDDPSSGLSFCDPDIEWDGTKYEDPKYDAKKVSELLGDEGSIAVQVHGGKSWPVGAKCRWKNIKVKILE